MWPDNETDIDLLGFDFLIDELLVLLKEPRLLPVTIGVTGDWGSGKSSLLAMAAKELDADKTADFIVVPFSPWKFEGYEDVKAALMQAVLRALHKAVADDKTNANKTKELFLGLVGRVKWFTIARTTGAAYLASQGAPPEMAALMAGGWIDTSDLEKAGETKADLAPASVADFREDFDALMKGLEKVQGLVVFVDDVDRCMPETIIDTFGGDPPVPARAQDRVRHRRRSTHRPGRDRGSIPHRDREEPLDRQGLPREDPPGDRGHPTAVHA